MTQINAIDIGEIPGLPIFDRTTCALSRILLMVPKEEEAENLQVRIRIFIDHGYNAFERAFDVLRIDILVGERISKLSPDAG